MPTKKGYFFVTKSFLVIIKVNFEINRKCNFVNGNIEIPTLNYVVLRFIC